MCALRFFVYLFGDAEYFSRRAEEVYLFLFESLFKKSLTLHLIVCDTTLQLT